MVEWFEDESFWSECYPYLFHNHRFEVAAEQAQQALALLGVHEGRVLDLCCGPGRHSVALAQRGFCVTGVDKSQFLLSKAQQRAREANVDIEFVREDMRRFVRPRTFDCALNMYNSFGYFEDQEDDLAVLRNVHESLKPGGACLIDIVSNEWLAHFHEPYYCSQEPDGTTFIQRHQILDDWTRQNIEWTLVKGEETRTFSFSIRIYSGQDLRNLMLTAGFVKVNLYGDLTGSDYGRADGRLIAVGHKAST